MNKRGLSIEIKLAWRNVWKNKRRTILTLLTIMVGCTMIILMNAFAKGGHDQMIEDSVALNTGHIQVHEKGFWEYKSIDYAVSPEYQATVINELKNNKKVAAFSKVVVTGGLLSHKDDTYGSMIQAVDPDEYKKVSNIYTKILPGGRYLTADDKTNIIMGYTLAKNLNVKVGDTVAMISQGFDGSFAAENLTVVGLFNSGSPDFDMGLMIMPLSNAMETFTMMGFVSSIMIRVTETDQMEEVRDDIRKVVDTKRIEVMGWDELKPDLVQFIKMDDISAYINDFILFMVVAFGILNTIQMSVFERIREFGVMLAIGTRPRQVTIMVIFESIFIALLGIVLGLVLGAALSYYFEINPIDYSAYAEEMKVWGVITVIFPADMSALNASLTAIITFTLAVLFTILPARKAAKLKPIDAIRHL